jgi:hypothetical protein
VPGEVELRRVEGRALRDELPRPRQAAALQRNDHRHLAVALGVVRRQSGEQVGELVEEAGAVRLDLRLLSSRTGEEQRGVAVRALSPAAADSDLLQLRIRDAQLDAALGVATLEQQSLLCHHESTGRTTSKGAEEHRVAGRLPLRGSRGENTHVPRRDGGLRHAPRRRSQQASVRP